MGKIVFFSALISIFLSSCNFGTKEVIKVKFKKVHSVFYNDNTDYFFASQEELAFPDTTFSVSDYNDEFFLPSGKSMNIKYEKLDPYKVFIFSEIKENGISFKAINPANQIEIKFDKLCQAFIVPHPLLTTIDIDNSLRLEQLVYTPRQEGSYLITIGTPERGCKQINKSFIEKNRSKEYEMMINKFKQKAQ